MFRKESKGWNRDDGIVKEDSKSMACVPWRMAFLT